MVTTRKKYPMNCQAGGDKAMLQKNRIRHCCQERWKWKPGLLVGLQKNGTKSGICNSSRYKNRTVVLHGRWCKLRKRWSLLL